MALSAQDVTNYVKSSGMYNYQTYEDPTNEGEGFELADVGRFAVSTVVDLGTSIADSLTLGYCDNALCETDKALNAIDDAMGTEFNDFYEDNQALVNMTSLIGGAFMPMGAAKLGAQMIKATAGTGSLVPRWYSKLERGQKVNKLRAERNLKFYGNESHRYKEAMSNLRTNTIAKTAADAIAWEAGWFGMMNGHAFVEDNYDLVDFAIGAGIGGMAGTVGWWMTKKAINAKAFDVEAAQNKPVADVMAYGALGETKGHTVGAMATMWSEGKKIDVTTLNQSQVDHLGQNLEHTLVGVERKLREMGDGVFSTAAREKKPGHKDLLNGMDYNNPYDVSDVQMLTRMAVENPSNFVGAQKFNYYDDAVPNYDDIIKTSLVERKPGQVMTPDGPIMAQLISHDWDLKGDVFAKAIADFDDTIIPSGVSVKQTNLHGRMVEEITIPNSKTFKGKGQAAKDFRGWLYKYANSGSRVNTPVVLRSADGKLVDVGTDRIQQELKRNRGAVDDLLTDINAPDPTKGRFVTPSEVDKVVGRYDLEHGIINKRFGHSIMPSTLSRIAMTAAGDSSIIVNKRATTLTNWEGDFTKMSTQYADKQWLEAGYALNNDPKLLLSKTPIKGDDVHRLQMAYSQLAQNLKVKGLEYTIKVGKEDKVINAGNIDELGELLLQRKAEIARDIVKKGGMYEQAAIHTNMKVSDIENLHAAGWDATVAKGQIDDLMVYSGREMDEFATARPIAVHGKNRRYSEIEEMKAQTMLDQNTMRDMHGAMIRENVATSGTKESQELLEATIWNQGFITIRDNIERLMTRIDQPSRFLASADQALRNQGQIGELMTTMGQNMIAVTNRHLEAMNERLLPAFQKVAQSATDNLQFEQLRRAIQKNADKTIDFDPATGKFPIRGTAKAGKDPEYLQYLEGGEIVATSNMIEFMGAYMPEAKKLLDTQNLLRANNNMPPLNDRGVWFPYEAVEDKFIAFQIASDNPKDIFMITANSSAELKDTMSKMSRDASITAKYDLVTREQLGRWNELLEYATLNKLTKADSSQKKAGIAVQAPRADSTNLDHLMRHMHATTWRNNRLLMKQAGAEVFQKLETSSAIARSAESSSAGNLFQKAEAKPNVADIATATMLNQSLLSKYPRLMMANDFVAIGVNQADEKLTNIFRTIRSNKATVTADDFAEIGREAAAQGIPMPWKNVDQYLEAKNLSKKADMSHHRIAQVNGIAATMNLRLMELSHAALTLLSTPVILSGQLVNEKYPLRAFMDTAAEIMKQSDDTKKIMAEAEKFGYTKSMVSEATKLMKGLHTNEKWDKFKGFIDGPLSKPSDWAEGATREYAYLMGYRLAQGKGIEDKALLRSAAHNFVIRAMGNYTSRQRPVLFQGQMGSVIGLYQTFMVTMGQNLYRYVEGADKKAIMALMGAQTGMFGLESLPMYQPFNRWIGAYYGSENTDIRSTVYEALGRDDDNTRSAAEFMLYGAPSALFQTALYTRGELQPRTPFRFDERGAMEFMPAGIDNMVQLTNFGADVVSNVGKTITSSGDAGDMTHAMLQSLAAQSVWRPIARHSELLMGRSYDRKGELIDDFQAVNPATLWQEPGKVLTSGFPTMARIIASRPLKEQATRNMKFNAGYYNTADRAEKSRVSRQVRRIASQNRDLTGSEFEKLQGDYLDNGGTPKGWKQVMKKAYQEAEVPYAERMAQFFKRNEAYAEIFASYD